MRGSEGQQTTLTAAWCYWDGVDGDFLTSNRRFSFPVTTWFPKQLNVLISGQDSFQFKCKGFPFTHLHHFSQVCKVKTLSLTYRSGKDNERLHLKDRISVSSSKGKLEGWAAMRQCWDRPLHDPDWVNAETKETFSSMSAPECLFASRTESNTHKSSTVNVNLSLKQ